MTRQRRSDSTYQQKKEQYFLKASFVRRRLRKGGYHDILDTIDSIVEAQGSTISWDGRSGWMVSDGAWEIVGEAKVDPLYVFCHPKILNQHPTTLLYYRCVSLLPEKGFKAIIRCESAPFERGTVEPGSIRKDMLKNIVTGINELMSNTVEQGKSLTVDELRGMFFAQAGMYIDGSWRNKIGEEGQLAVWSLLARTLLNFEEIASVSPSSRHGDVLIADVDQTYLSDHWDEYRSINLTNGASIIYGSEPDLLVQSASGDTLCAVEVKAGLDPAGALERTGAVLKSFESVLGEYPNAETILVTSCETEESKRRLNESSVVHTTYITTELMTNQTQQRKFVTRIRRAARLIRPAGR